MIIEFDEDSGYINLYRTDWREEPYESIPIEEAVELWQKRNDMAEIERIGDTLRVEYKDQAEIGRVMLTDGVWCSLYYLDGDGEPIQRWRGI